MSTHPTSIPCEGELPDRPRKEYPDLTTTVGRLRFYGCLEAMDDVDAELVQMLTTPEQPTGTFYLGGTL